MSIEQAPSFYRKGMVLFGIIAATLAIDLILCWKLRNSEAWIYALVITCGVAAIVLWIDWYGRFPYIFGRSPQRYRPTSFGQHGRFWQNLVWFMFAGAVLPMVASFREIGLNQVAGSLLFGYFLYFWIYVHLWNLMNQRERDLRAGKLLRDLAAGIERDFALYLRPFHTTGTMLSVRESRNGRPNRQFYDLEAVIAEALEPTRPLIALGRPGEQLGVGRVASTMEGWFGQFKLSANTARVLFVLPADGEGTRDEIEWILEKGFIGKCIFVMPGDWSERWESVSKQTQSVKLEYPDYQDGGCLFTLESDGVKKGRLIGATELTKLLDDPRELECAIESLYRGTAGITLSPTRVQNVDRPSDQGLHFMDWFYWNVFIYFVSFAVLACVVYLLVF